MIPHHDYREPAPRPDFVQLLSEGVRGSTAEADQVAAMITDRDSFAALWALLAHPDPLVRLRAADAAEKASRARPDLLASARGDLLASAQGEIACQVVPFAARLSLDADEVARLMRRIEDTVLNNPSPFIQAEALRAAFALAAEHRRLQPRARALAKDVLSSPSPELAGRARELLAGG